MSELDKKYGRIDGIFTKKQAKQIAKKIIEIEQEYWEEDLDVRVLLGDFDDIENPLDDIFDEVDAACITMPHIICVIESNMSIAQYKKEEENEQ